MTKIDPDNMVKFDCSSAELEQRLLFWVAAAGKNAHSTARALHRFLNRAGLMTRARCLPPFQAVRLFDQAPDDLPLALKYCGFGCYHQRAGSFRWLAASGLDLEHCGLEDLLACPGIGPKTARAFLLYSRPDQQYAVLDRHVLAALQDAGHRNVPAVTPNTQSYARWEVVALEEAVRLGLSPLEFDRQKWLARREKWPAKWLRKQRIHP